MKTSVIIVIGSWLTLSTTKRLTTRSILENETDTNTETDIFNSNWVTVKPKQTEIKVFAGDSVTIECEASGSPQPIIQFYNDVSRLTKHKILPDRTGFSTTEVVKSTGRLYLVARNNQIIYCKASSGSKTAEAAIKIIVSKKPTFLSNSIWDYGNKEELLKNQAPKITFYDTMYLDNVGNTVAFPCANTGDDETNIVWMDSKKNVIEKNGDKRFKISSSGDLIIKSIEWNDMGIYKCIAKNHYGQDTITTFLYPISAED